MMNISVSNLMMMSSPEFTAVLVDRWQELENTQLIENGCFVVRQSTYGPENDRIANTTLITGKGELWLTKKVIKAGVLKAVAV